MPQSVFVHEIIAIRYNSVGLSYNTFVCGTWSGFNKHGKFPKKNFRLNVNSIIIWKFVLKHPLHEKIHETFNMKIYISIKISLNTLQNTVVKIHLYLSIFGSYFNEQMICNSIITQYRKK